jgi:hypothetical protein
MGEHPRGRERVGHPLRGHGHGLQDSVDQVVLASGTNEPTQEQLPQQGQQGHFHQQFGGQNHPKHRTLAGLETQHKAKEDSMVRF